MKYHHNRCSCNTRGGIYKLCRLKGSWQNVNNTMYVKTLNQKPKTWSIFGYFDHEWFMDV